MIFKHPEWLWGFLFLVIPILLHLFNLRKFIPVKFTNVAFVKDIISQHNKPASIKRWIALILRILTLACIIIAFAQPQRYIVEKDSDSQLVIYLDNSFSMQAKGDQGALLKRAAQDLLKTLPQESPIALFTNDHTFINYSASDLEEALLNVDYSSYSIDFKEIILKSKSLFSNKKSLPKKLIIISDLKNIEVVNDQMLDFDLSVIPLVGNDNNIAISSVQIKTQNAQESILKVSLQSHFKKGSIPVALYQNEILASKIQVQISNHLGTVEFVFPTKDFNRGVIRIEDQGLDFDNSLYFSIQKPKIQEVLSINAVDDLFLKKIYGNAFEYKAMSEKKIDYDQIPFQDLVILNQIDEISSNLEVSLRNLMNSGKHLVVIPSENSNLQQYNALLKNRVYLQNEKTSDFKISRINFSHPIYKKVFTKKFSNFRYPTVKNSFKITSQTLSTVLTLENGNPFLMSNRELSIFSAPIDHDNSDFQSSTLIVPTLYNMSKQSFLQPTLYYTIGKNNAFDVETNLSSDRILKISDGKTTFIPLQQKIGDNVRIFTDEQPITSGYYKILKEEISLMEVSYNYNREESFGKANPVGKNIDTLDDIDAIVSELKGVGHGDVLWWWFVTFALIFAISEMLVLKKS